MSQSGTSLDLIVRAADLAHAAPNAWAAFLTAYRQHVDKRKDECVQAPLALLQVAQGRAQADIETLGLLENAVSKARQIAGK